MALQLGKDARISAGEESTAGTEVSRTAVARLVSTTLQRAIERDVVPHLVGSGAAAANPVDFFETVATVESTVPSFTLKVNESVPFAFAFGV
jgi:hypothetical protein